MSNFELCRLVILPFLLIGLMSCGGGGSSPNTPVLATPVASNTISPETSLIFMENSGVHCRDNAISSDDSAQILRSSGLDVTNSVCAQVTSNAQADTSCLTSTAEINIHRIPSQSLVDAELLGYSPITALANTTSTGYEEVSCRTVSALDTNQPSATSLVYQEATDINSDCPVKVRPLSEGVQQLKWLNITALQTSCARFTDQADNYQDLCSGVRSDVNLYRIPKSHVDLAKAVGFTAMPEVASQQNNNSVFELEACTAEKRKMAPDQNSVWIYVSRGGKQCESSGETLATSKTRLTELFLSPVNERCGNITNIALPASCGTSTLGINLFEIPVSDTHAALEAGFLIAHNNVAYQFGDCPSI